MFRNTQYVLENLNAKMVLFSNSRDFKSTGSVFAFKNMYQTNIKYTDTHCWVIFKIIYRLIREVMPLNYAFT